MTKRVPRHHTAAGKRPAIDPTQGFVDVGELSVQRRCLAPGLSLDSGHGWRVPSRLVGERPPIERRAGVMRLGATAEAEPWPFGSHRTGVDNFHQTGKPAGCRHD